MMMILLNLMKLMLFIRQKKSKSVDDDVTIEFEENYTPKGKPSIKFEELNLKSKAKHQQSKKVNKK